MDWLTHMVVAVAGLGIGVGIVVHLEESKEFEERVARHGCVVQHIGHRDVCTEPDGKIFLRHP